MAEQATIDFVRSKFTALLNEIDSARDNARRDETREWLTEIESRVEEVVQAFDADVERAEQREHV